MKKFLVTVLAVLTVISMSACTSTKVHELLDKNGELKGYVKETLQTVDKWCTKLEFMDENKNVTNTMEVTEDGLYYRWSIFSNRSDSTYLHNNINSDLNGTARVLVWDRINKCHTGKEYYTYPCSGKIMEEYDSVDFGDDGSWDLTSAKYYNEDGSVKWSYSAKYGEYFVIGFSIQGEERCIIIREYDKNGNDVAITDYYEDTLEFISSQSWEYSDESTLAPKYICYYNADGSLWYKEENVFDEEGYITNTLLYDANGNPIDEIPQ